MGGLVKKKKKRWTVARRERERSKRKRKSSAGANQSGDAGLTNDRNSKPGSVVEKRTVGRLGGSLVKNFTGRANMKKKYLNTGWATANHPSQTWWHQHGGGAGKKK